ncbi:hypothetical protein F5144DRAFT_649215 [Chaetomium tenue]|uniref:Uncharacterized protein n=1 Tax=Chaetomium tenue TaxID=1854479 RepID=A0ACB7PAT6_9PEZI|nr:hypothetical protein F5144DRAFT_649215 [Chaetomium globosum]
MRLITAASCLLATLAVASPIPVDDAKSTADALKNPGLPGTGLANAQGPNVPHLDHPSGLADSATSAVDSAKVPRAPLLQEFYVGPGPDESSSMGRDWQNPEAAKAPWYSDVKVPNTGGHTAVPDAEPAASLADSATGPQL